MNPVRGTFVLLRAGGLHLLLPQSDVGACEYLAARPVSRILPGLLSSPDPRDPRWYAALSDAMTLLAECPPDRFIACTLAATPDSLLWCWDELRVLIDVELQPAPLPAAIATPSTPVMAFVMLDGSLAFLCSAAELCRFALQGLEAGHAS